MKIFKTSNINKHDFYNDFRDSIDVNIATISKVIFDYTDELTTVINKVNTTITYKLRPTQGAELKQYLLSLSSPVENIKSVCDYIHNINAYSRILKLKDDIAAKNIELIKVKRDKKYITYKVYSKFFDAYNRNGVKLLVNGGRFNIGGDCGSLEVLRVTRDKNTYKKIDHRKSNKYKQFLISNNEIPYLKKDAERCAAEGVPYNGKEWLIYHYEDYYYYVDWQVYINDYGEYYRFMPSRSQNKTKRDVIIKSMKTKLDVFQYSMGVLPYLYLLDEVFSDFHTIFKSLSKT